MRHNLLAFAVCLIAPLCVGALCSPLFAAVRTSDQADAATAARIAHLSAIARFTGVPQLIGRTESSKAVPITIVLKLRDQSELEDLLKRLYDPKDALFGHYLTPSEFQAEFRPTRADVDAVVDFLKTSGYTVTSASQPMGLVKATASANVAEKTFGVHLHDYVSPTGMLYVSQDSPAALPASIASKVTTVLGLYTGFEPKRFLRKAMPALASLLSVTGHEGLAPSDVRRIYSMGNVGGTANGAQQTVGLFEEGTYSPGDITKYINYYGTGTPTITPISIDGYNLASPPGGAAAEYTLDIDMYLLLAPQITNIEVFDNSDNITTYADFFTQLIDSYAAMAVPQKGLPLPTAISISYGVSELYLLRANNPEGPADAVAENSALETLASQGQSVFCASGDAAAWTDQSLYPTELPNTSDPGSEPYLTSVGGTDLDDSATETYVSETSWFDPGDNGRGNFGTGGGGGVSQIWSLPLYQDGAFTSASDPQGSATMRNVPDVSAYGDYDTGGYDIYFSDPSYGGAWYAYNGTSASSPLWAAFVTDVNQARVALGYSTIGLANNAIYAIAESANYGADFHDIADGSSNGYYNTGTAYDNSTGWGSYRGGNLFGDLLEYGIVPTISSLSPPNAIAGSGAVALTVQGTNYFSNSVVLAGTTPLATTYVSSPKLTATIPSSLTSALGQLSITVQNGPAGESSAPSYFALVPGPATRFAVVAPLSAVSGVPFNFTVTALDAYGHTATAYAGTVVLSSSDHGLGVLLPSGVTLTKGTGTFSATLATAGNQTVTARQSSHGPSVIGTSGLITVAPGVATHFQMAVPSHVTSETPFMVIVTARDANGNIATGFTGTAALTSNDPNASKLGSAVFTSGGKGNAPALVTLVTPSSAGWTITVSTGAYALYARSTPVIVVAGLASRPV